MIAESTWKDVVAHIVLFNVRHDAYMVQRSLMLAYRLGEAVTCVEAFLVCSLIGASTMPFKTCGLISVISFKPPGLSSGLVYHMIATGLKIADEWLYLMVAQPAMYLSGVAAVLKLVKAVRKSVAALGAYTILPPQMRAAG
jgi:hypothetical protein